MNVREAYNVWAEQYDSNDNRTRDLEEIALRETLSGTEFESCLEIGCGTGKNSLWLASEGRQITAVDFSEQMLEKARQKVKSPNASFIRADILKPWNFVEDKYDLVSFSLVLEHVEHLDDVFKKAAAAVKPGAHVYVGELHPFKQYTGTKARFEKGNNQHILDCYLHNISDFVTAARNNGLMLRDVREYFDNNDRTMIPRILALLFVKK